MLLFCLSYTLSAASTCSLLSSLHPLPYFGSVSTGSSFYFSCISAHLQKRTLILVYLRVVQIMHSLEPRNCYMHTSI
ncbi:hypothetical protein BDZ94DRAFT_1268217 [Collybia nuda]|uniref:Uncharacterized protein n=1 Tax=Collybia nuda TaxID=64659 RepID=A0A9P5XYL3_9AGAR|nr:hypothetical protein BDZ94DRAFT_1268217 [Collybia nuda]